MKKSISHTKRQNEQKVRFGKKNFWEFPLLVKAAGHKAVEQISENSLQNLLSLITYILLLHQMAEWPASIWWKSLCPSSDTRDIFIHVYGRHRENFLPAIIPQCTCRKSMHSHGPCSFVQFHMLSSFASYAQYFASLILISQLPASRPIGATASWPPLRNRLLK